MGFLSVPINEEIMSCSTWQEVLAHAITRFDVMDEVNAVTSFHRAAKLYREVDAGETPLEQVYRTDGLQQLLDLIWHFARRCRPQQLSNATWACAVLLWKDAALLQRLCDYAVQRLGGYVPQNVANTIWAIATLGFLHEGFLDLVPAYVTLNVRDFTPQDLANTCWAFAKLQRPCDTVFTIILQESLVRLDTFQAQNMSNIVWGCATILYKDEASMYAIATYAAAYTEEFSTQELSNLTWGMATLNLLCQPWMEASGLEMTKRTSECCPQDLSNTLWAYGTLLHKKNEYLRALNWEVMRQIESFSPQGLANVTWGISAIEYRDIKLLTSISEEIIRRPLDHMTPPDISTLLYSFAVLSWLHAGALAKLRRCVRYSMPVFATRDVANVSWAMVILSHRDDEIFRRLMERADDMMPEFSIQGLCNIAWAFVRFGLGVPAAVAQGIAEETVKRREELSTAPGDALLLSDAVCSEWVQSVPRAMFEACDEIGREQYNKAFELLHDFDNLPSLGCSQVEIERYQQRIVGLDIIQLGRRLTLEMLLSFGMLEESQPDILQLRAPREEWLWNEIQNADPTDGTLQHKTTGAWVLSCGTFRNVGINIVASGTPMSEELRFVSCPVEHNRANDAEFQVVNKAADQLLGLSGSPAGHLRLDISEIPCMSCMGALRQFQKAFPNVKLRVSFSIRKVSEVCNDLSGDAIDEPELPPPRRHLDPLPARVPDNRGRGRPMPPPGLRSPGARLPRACAPAPAINHVQQAIEVGTRDKESHAQNGLAHSGGKAVRSQDENGHHTMIANGAPKARTDNNKSPARNGLVPSGRLAALSQEESEDHVGMVKGVPKDGNSLPELSQQAAAVLHQTTTSVKQSFY